MYLCVSYSSTVDSLGYYIVDIIQDIKVEEHRLGGLSMNELLVYINYTSTQDKIRTKLGYD